MEVRASVLTGSLESEASGLSGGCACCVTTNGCSRTECSETALSESEYQALKELLQTADEKAAQLSQDVKSPSLFLFPFGRSHPLIQKA